jgi:hypothetical protein
MIVNLIRAWLWTAKGAVAIWMMVEIIRQPLKAEIATDLRK